MCSKGADIVQKRYDAVVVGSGFGGAVAACRLAQAGLRVAVLERGRRYPLGTFPRNWTDVTDGWLWQDDQGLFDVRQLDSEVTAVQSAAYGGGSHIYANVHIRAPHDLFGRGWPDGYSRTALDPYYDLVAYMLDVRPISADQPLEMPAKTHQMLRVAERLGRAEQLFLPNIAVNFGDPSRAVPNKFGVEQFGCRHCGECDIGCNFQAKNTLDLNYLAVAEQRGAEVGTRCEVTRVAVGEGGYEVTYVDHAGKEAQDKDGTDAVRVIQAPTVVLTAGAVNTTELLLRCRDQYGTLRALPERLGTGYSANGDFLAFAFDTDQPFEPGVGPTITTSMVYDRGAGSKRRWFVFQDGGVPRQVVSLLQIMDDERFGGLLRVPHDLTEHARQAARERIGAAGVEAKDDLAIFLSMGRDTADGTIGLLPVTRDLRITWNTTSNLALYETQERFCEDVARALGGRATYNPLWRRFRIPVAVHNLGGCPMADDPAQGVTDGTGQVHGHPGLYVLDGASLPSATGVNPSHTIAAVAERNIEAAIRKITGNAAWVAPERAAATPVHEPMSAVTIPLGGTPPVATPGTGLIFTETMRGFLRRNHQPVDDFRGAAAAGRRAGTTASFTLNVTSPFFAEFIADDAHQMTAEGVVYVDGVTGPGGARVGNGVVNLLVAGETPTSRRMLYALPFFGADGKPYLLDGYKDIRDRGNVFDIWTTTTTLYTCLRRGHTPGGEVLATGILHLPALTFPRQVVTMRATGTSAPLRQLEVLARFGYFFLGSLSAVFVAPRLPRFVRDLFPAAAAASRGR